MTSLLFPVHVTSHLQNLTLQMWVDWVVCCREHMHALPIPEHTAENPSKGQKDFLAGVLRAGPPFLPVPIATMLSYLWTWEQLDILSCQPYVHAAQALQS